MLDLSYPLASDFIRTVLPQTKMHYQSQLYASATAFNADRLAHEWYQTT